MNTLLITNDFPPMGGGEATYYARICDSLPPERITILAPAVPGYHAADARRPYRILRRWAPVSPQPLARLLQLSLFLVYTLAVARHDGIDVVHIGHLYLGLLGLILKRIHKIPYVLYLHGGEMAAYMRWRVVRSVVRRIVRDARMIVVNSNFTRLNYQALGISLPPVETLTVSVPTDRFRPGLDPSQIRKRYGLDEQRVILTVGRLVERKGHDVVIRALDSLRRTMSDVRYVIAGRGPEEPRLRALVRQLGLEAHVLFIGYIPDPDLPYLYAASDVFVMPSRALSARDGIEGFGIAFLEAGACGKPVIGGNSGGIADAVIDGETGILVDPTDDQRLAEALAYLLHHPQEAARLGQGARQRAEQLESLWAASVLRIWKGTHP